MKLRKFDVVNKERNCRFANNSLVVGSFLPLRIDISYRKC